MEELTEKSLLAAIDDMEKSENPLFFEPSMVIIDSDYAKKDALIDGMVGHKAIPGLKKYR